MRERYLNQPRHELMTVEQTAAIAKLEAEVWQEWEKLAHAILYQGRR